MKRHRRLTLEHFEPRLLLDASYRSLDGSGNNLANPDWGSVGALELRIAPAGFADGIGAPAGPSRENARVISNEVNQQTSFVFSENYLTDLSWVLGTIREP